MRPWLWVNELICLHTQKCDCGFTLHQSRGAQQWGRFSQKEGPHLTGLMQPAARAAAPVPTGYLPGDPKIALSG